MRITRGLQTMIKKEGGITTLSSHILISCCNFLLYFCREVASVWHVLLCNIRQVYGFPALRILGFIDSYRFMLYGLWVLMILSFWDSQLEGFLALEILRSMDYQLYGFIAIGIPRFMYSQLQGFSDLGILRSKDSKLLMILGYRDISWWIFS